MDVTELAKAVESLAKACEAMGKLLNEEQARRLELGERYADLLTRFNECIAARELRQERAARVSAALKAGRFDSGSLAEFW